MSEPVHPIAAEEVWAQVNAIVASPAFVHSPRLGRLIVEARRRGVAEQGSTIAALLSAGERLPAESHAATPRRRASTINRASRGCSG